MKKDETGRRGEELALRALEQRGLRLLDRNWRSGHREIDLVMESPDRLHFVEVKTLTPPLQIQPFEKVDPRKQANLAAAARHYVACRKILKEVQFDVVSVVLDGERSQVEYIPEAFYPIVHRF
ncbi:MAG: YraN family protein [Bacteroidales bacterium]|nr:YraN family protein [Bacteroidales bacterium]